MTATSEITVKVNADVTAFRRDLRAVRIDLLKLRILAASPTIVALMCACALVLGVALGRLI